MKILHSFEQPCCCRQWATTSILTRGVWSLPHALTSRWSNKNALEVSVLMRNYSPRHYDDVIMGATASQITSLAIVYSTVYSCADQSKNQSSVSLAFVWGIHRGPMNSSHKWPVTRKIFPFDDVIMHRHNYTSMPYDKLISANEIDPSTAPTTITALVIVHLIILKITTHRHTLSHIRRPWAANTMREWLLSHHICC